MQPNQYNTTRASHRNPRIDSGLLRVSSRPMILMERSSAPLARPQPRQGDRAEDRASGCDGAHEYPAGEW
jgi:hypothetical protein